MRTRLHTVAPRLRMAGAAALGLLLSACARDAPQDALKPDGPIARKQDHLWDLTFGIATVIFFVVIGLILFALFRFRARSDDDAPKQVHGNPRLEVTLTILPALLLAVVAVPTVGTIFDLAKKPSGDPLEVTVHGKLWWWELEYPKQDLRTANEMHIPAGRPIYLSLQSDNVIHSWWIPKLAGKRDVVPGRTNHMTIQADHPGTYMGQCAEFCGLSHANMRMRVIAQTPEDFDAWVTAQKADARSDQTGLAKAGRNLFLNRPDATQQCAGCHTVEGLEGATGRVGPNLTHVSSRTTFAGGIFKRTPANLARWLRNPPGQKPGSKMPNLNLTEEEIQRLVAYLESLK
jgi:cytochrome c oxidase subunit II